MKFQTIDILMVYQMKLYEYILRFSAWNLYKTFTYLFAQAAKRWGWTRKTAKPEVCQYMSLKLDRFKSTFYHTTESLTMMPHIPELLLDCTTTGVWSEFVKVTRSSWYSTGRSPLSSYNDHSLAAAESLSPVRREPISQYEEQMEEQLSHWGLQNVCHLKQTFLLYFDDLVQNCSNSSALAMELLQSCTKPFISWHKFLTPLNLLHFPEQT